MKALVSKVDKVGMPFFAQIMQYELLTQLKFLLFMN